MSDTTGHKTRQRIIVAGAIALLAILSVQAYSMATSGSLSGSIHTVVGSVDPPSNSTITVTGNGQVSISPDRALLTVGVNTQGSSAQAAAQQNAKTMSDVISALEGLGINSSDIQTISYNIYEQQTYPVDQQGCSGPSAGTNCAAVQQYEVDNEIQVTVYAGNEGIGQLGPQVGAAIDAAVAQGANELYGVQFTASNSAIQQADQQALELAVQDAAGQAKAIASSLSVTITGVVSVTTSPGYTPSPIVYEGDSTGSNQTPIDAPQSLTVTASVTAVYAIS